jgi:hypothetical protein
MTASLTPTRARVDYALNLLHGAIEETAAAHRCTRERLPGLAWTHHLAAAHLTEKAGEALERINDDEDDPIEDDGALTFTLTAAEIVAADS